jgi:hypothetical protein
MGSKFYDNEHYSFMPLLMHFVFEHRTQSGYVVSSTTVSYTRFKVSVKKRKKTLRGIFNSQGVAYCSKAHTENHHFM